LRYRGCESLSASPVGARDSNHAEIVRELRERGASAPDLIVGYQGVTALIEVKNGCRYQLTTLVKRSRLAAPTSLVA
jgi:hypothetical protein